MNCHLAENQLGPFLKHGPAFPPFIASLFMKSMRVPHSLLIQDDCNQNLKIVFEVPLICQNISSQFDQIGIAKYKIKQNDVAMHVEMIKLFKVQVGLTRVDQIKCQMCTYDLKRTWQKVKTAKDFFSLDGTAMLRLNAVSVQSAF